MDQEPREDGRLVGRPSGSITLADIASVAGVSPGTASRALNGRDGVNAATRDRVQEAARRLGYQPNALARGLLSGRSYTVGLITTDSFGRFSIPIMFGAEDALGAGSEQSPGPNRHGGGDERRSPGTRSPGTVR